MKYDNIRYVDKYQIVGKMAEVAPRPSVHPSMLPGCTQAAARNQLCDEVMTELNATLDPTLPSWVASANAVDCDFPIRNLPFGRFRRAGGTEGWSIGIAIGDQVLDLRPLV